MRESSHLNPEEKIQRVLSAPDEELLSVKEVDEADIPAPEKARIYPSPRCRECGENFMEIKVHLSGLCDEDEIVKLFIEHTSDAMKKSFIPEQP
ncbi:MAG: hypothetical protein ACE14P_08865 [Methanotrichaceae archaeon]